jgi:hypothetical protein
MASSTLVTHDRSVAVVTCYELDGWGSIPSPVGAVHIHIPGHNQLTHTTMNFLTGLACLNDLIQYRRHLGVKHGLRGWGSSPGGVKNYYFFMLSRLALGSTQPPIQWVPGALSRG